MNSTTSCFLPAASRAGTAGYSADSSASLAPADSAGTRSFDELCSEEQGRGEAEVNDNNAEAHDPFAGEAETAEAVTETADDSVDETDEVRDADDNDSAETGLVVAPPLLESPSIIQTLLTGLREVASAPVANPLQANPAENAAQAAISSTKVTSARADAGDPLRAAESAPATTVRNGRARGRATPTSTDGHTAEGTTRRAARETPSSAVASASTADKATGVATAGPASEAARAKATPVADPSAPPAIARLQQAKGHSEKSAGHALGTQVAQIVSGQNKFLNSDKQDVTAVVRAAGTRSALSAGPMSTSSTTTQRHSEIPVLATAATPTAGQGAGTESLSVDWKGWTNGGGEPGSSAAPISQLGDRLGQHGVAAAPANAGFARIATSVAPTVAPAAPTVPADAAEALAPIHSAIERLVLHGRDQLALTVRFEQGGSLSIKLAMNQGEIATQIQTDVPGLEAALRSSWGELAQDWNSRGWKLGNPEFTSNNATYQSRGDSTADGRGADRQAREQAGDAPTFGGRAFSPARLRHAGAVTLSGLDALRAAALARRGIHTWA